ncbi:peptidyl-prolyl cis-trans isomerase FKBP2 isoform X2 [Desmodus rotundus]|uniref:peptidyl-prolyl cis-trans isomerase FKBP2 isoform X2 n=1 Tax=Desmodus rotundus TaxID=9430 RepID=UPI0039E69B57
MAQDVHAGAVSVVAGPGSVRHETQLGPDSTVHLPECPGHSRGGRGQTETADRGQEAGRPLSHQIAERGRPAHALHGGCGGRACGCEWDFWGPKRTWEPGSFAKGKLEDGTEFDSSLPQNQPFVFSLGTGQVIKGWDQGLLGMCEGEKRKLVIPSELGYGERGAPPKIPGGATLVFEVELLKIERRSEL